MVLILGGGSIKSPIKHYIQRIHVIEFVQTITYNLIYVIIGKRVAVRVCCLL